MENNESTHFLFFFLFTFIPIFSIFCFHAMLLFSTPFSVVASKIQAEITFELKQKENIKKITMPFISIRAKVEAVGEIRDPSEDNRLPLKALCFG